MTRAFWLLLLLLVVLPAQGQEPALPDSVLRIAGDTLAVTPAHKSPALAMTLSAILPGMGQFYNQSYWKVPVIAGLGGYFIYTFLQNNRDYLAYRDLYQAELAMQSPNLILVARNRSFRDFYRAQRDSFGWYFLLLYLINIADAYVDASLFSFDVGDNLASRGMPDAIALPSALPRVRLQIRF